MSSAVRNAFRRGLLRWHKQHRRVLPWRSRRTPYRVWISEIMLQQTRVDQALPYFQRFMTRFPSLRALARAPRSAVLKAWEGLGYYARAIHAHETARLLVRRHNGQFPRTLEGLRALPGIGPYSAAAIGSLAFGLPAAVVDGNVLRVMARVGARRSDVKSSSVRREIERTLNDLLPPGQAGAFNEALMELGALVCTPRRPQCPVCPLRKVCRAAAEGSPERYPVRPARARVPHKIVGAALVVNHKGEFLIAQRKESSMLGGLWEFPGGTREPGETMEDCIARELKEELGVTVRVGRHFLTVKHAFSHFTMALHAHWARLVRGRPRAIHCAAWKWVALKNLRNFPFGRADVRIIEALEKSGS